MYYKMSLCAFMIILCYLHAESLVVCEALVPIPFGHVSYHIVDTTMVLPGDLAYYTCDTLYTLQGPEYRVCLRNGTWGGEEPECIGKL